MIYLVDIDNTVVKTTNGDYENSEPMQDRINYINKLYDLGNTIIYSTARGANSGKDWEEFTVEQLNKFGCKYTHLVCGKPHYDFWIDDKAIHPDDFFKSEK